MDNLDMDNKGEMDSYNTHIYHSHNNIHTNTYGNDDSDGDSDANDI